MNEESRKSAYLLSRRPSQVFPESTKNMVTSSGKCCLFIMALAITLLIIGYWTEGAATPNGELRQWYGAELCSAPGSSFAVKDRSTFDAFVLRPSAGWEPGSACPVEVGSGEATTSPPVEVALEASDGWRAGGMYKPLFALPSGSYASIAIEVVDANGGTVFETGVYNLGPDDAYPWQAPSEDMMPAAAQTAEQLACACSDACVYSQDGVCDDGGEGAEYNTCGVQGIDCTDCGSRCDIDDEDDSDDDVASPPSTSRRLLFGASGGELGVADYGEQEEVAAAAAMESEAGAGRCDGAVARPRRPAAAQGRQRRRRCHRRRRPCWWRRPHCDYRRRRVGYGKADARVERGQGGGDLFGKRAQLRRPNHVRGGWPLLLRRRPAVLVHVRPPCDLLRIGTLRRWLRRPRLLLVRGRAAQLPVV